MKCVKVDVEARSRFPTVEDAKLAKTERQKRRATLMISLLKKKSKGRQRFKKAIETKRKDARRFVDA